MRVEQARAQTGVKRTDHLARRHAARGNAPIAGGRVVHRIVKTRGRELPVVGGQLLAQGVAVVAIGARGAEHRGQRCGIGPGMGHGLQPQPRLSLITRLARRRSAEGSSVGTGNTEGADT